MPGDLTRDEVTNFLKEWVRAYESASPDFFNFFAPNATFFTISSPTRIDGVEEYRRGFEPELTQQKNRRSQLLSLDVQPAGGTAVVSYHNRITLQGRTTNLKGTAVVGRDEKGAPRIIHLHMSPLAAPAVPTAVGRTPEEITLLEERVATAAAAVGTPK
jgi:hypothetical protein